MSAPVVEMVLTATQRFRCSQCGREEKTTQLADAFAGPGAAPLAFAVKLPDGWHVFDGRPVCSLNCALLVLDKAWPDWRPSKTEKGCTVTHRVFTYRRSGESPQFVTRSLCGIDDATGAAEDEEIAGEPCPACVAKERAIGEAIKAALVTVDGKVVEESSLGGLQQRKMMMLRTTLLQRMRYAQPAPQQHEICAARTTVEVDGREGEMAMAALFPAAVGGEDALRNYAKAALIAGRS